MKNNKSSQFSRFSVIGIAIFFVTFLFSILIYASRPYCIEKKNQENCSSFFSEQILVKSDYLAPIGTTLLSVVLTAVGFYAIEVIRRKDIKPKIKVSFLPKSPKGQTKGLKEDSRICLPSQYVVRCEPHYAFKSHGINSSLEKKFAGCAYYVRVRIDNKGASSIKNCRAFLSDIKKANKVEDISQNKYDEEYKYEDFLPLLWAYENKDDDSLKTIYSKGHGYADIFVVYDKLLTPEFIKESDTKKNIWFLKLKTKIRADKYDNKIGIARDENCVYELTVTICGDEADSKEIKLIIIHKKRSGELQVGYKEYLPEISNYETIVLPDLEDPHCQQDLQKECPDLFEEDKIKDEVKKNLIAEKQDIYYLL